MRADLNLFAAITALAVGFTAFWSNPSRKINVTFLVLSFHAALWLVCLGTAFRGGFYGQLWLRVTVAIGAFFPLHLWFIKEIIVTGGTSLSQIRSRCFKWLFVCVLLSAFTFTDSFVLFKSTRANPGFVWGWYIYIIGNLCLYGLLFRQTVLQIRDLTGAARLELQIVLLGGTAAAFTVILLMGVRAVFTPPWSDGLRALVVLSFYAMTVIAITTYRIFDARQLLLVAAQKITLTILVALSAYISNLLLTLILPDFFSFITATALTLWFATTLGRWLNSVLRFYPQANVARQAAFAAARRESRLDNLEDAFLGILKGWGQTDHALLISGGKESLRGGGFELAGDSAAVPALRQLRWVTPERLAREKETPDRASLSEFLAKHKLGALVIGEGPTLTAFIGVGIPASRRPFTFPQITQLMELASIIESALERAHFYVKAQHAEQLATVGLLGASLAHEIRNPLVSIKTFVQLLPTHHQDPAFRAKFFSLIGEEVSRIDRLTEQLLDLASPRAYVAEAIELHPVLRASLDLVTAKAADKCIQFLTDLQASPDQALTDASAAKQVLLNLCFNAIQAVESRPGDRWVKISTKNVNLGIEMIVEDSGPGIAPEIRSKLFQPFHSTKSTGFGLGLAICSDILGGLNATISVDSSAPGQGAVFRVIFPCPVLSSS